MVTRVTVTTGEVSALVLSYPRAVDPVFGEELTELAKLPPHFEMEFTVNAGFDLLVAEMPVPAEAEQAPAGEGVDAGGCAPPIVAMPPPRTVQEAA